jgi:surface protein
MNGMFAHAAKFNQDLSSWNVGNVTNIQSMFYKATNFNQNISNWNVNNVTDMQTMFYNLPQYTDLGSINSSGTPINYFS